MKKNRVLMIFVLVICLALTSSLMACKKPTVQENDTLVVGYSDFSSKFSPFFAKTAYDQDASNMTMVNLLTTDRQGNIIYNAIDGETTKYQGKDYTYKGMANFDVDIRETETVYTITIRSDIKFSDGKPLTIDDVIFSMYVLSDPSYTGSATLYSQPIKGMEDYRTNGIDKTEEAATYMVDAKALAYEYGLFYNGVEEENTLTESEMVVIDWLIENTVNTPAFDWVSDYSLTQLQGWYGGATEEETFANIATDELFGFEYHDHDNDPDTDDVLKIEEEKYFLAYYSSYAGDLQRMKAVQMANEEAKDKGVVVKSISGIKKTGPYTMTVTTEGFDATTIYQLGIDVAPIHYYGDTAKYNYKEEKYGFDKGDLSIIRAKTTKPMGAGAYIFQKFENGVIYYESNTSYFKGAPKIKYVQFKETTDADKVPGVIAGTFDLTDPSFNNKAIDAIKDANGGSLVGSKIRTSTVDNLGYGYIGICADNVKVGNDPKSAESKSLRKAFTTVLSVYREIAIDSYYGDRASVINYPISNTSWAAPQATDEGYELAFSKNKDGNAIYTANMTAEQKYAAALNAAKEYLIAAGYTWDSGTGKFTAAPEGASLQYTIIIPGDGEGDHPSYAILTYAEAALEKIGITLNINDPTNSNDLWNALESGQAEMWCAAWQATIDPDMYQVYYSTNVVGLGGTDSNHYAIKDNSLDEKIMAARKSADQSVRKALYKECLDIIIDWAVEIPVYQRQNAIIFSAERIDLDTLTPDITTFWGWMKDIELLELKNA